MFLAKEDATGLPVALRFIGAVPDAVRERLVAAVPTLRAVDHPHVSQLLDVVAGPSGTVVVLGAAEGGSLAGIIGARGVLPAGEVVTACAPIAEGLTEVHRRGIVHGDLTLDDIVFSLDGRPMVAGVGLVQVGVALRAHQHARPIPPEVAAGSPPGPASDVYGLASAALVALTGALPSAQVTLPGVTPGAEALLVAGLDVNPQRRPNATNLGNAFFAIADPAPVELVLDEGQATTGSLPRVPASPPQEDDIAAYMRRSTSMGRRARRRADAGESAAAEEQGAAPGPSAAGAGAAQPGAPAPGAGHDPDSAASGSRRRRRSPADPADESDATRIAPAVAADAPETARSGGRRSGRRGADDTSDSARSGRRSAARSSGDAPTGPQRHAESRAADAGGSDEAAGGRSRRGRVDAVWVVSVLVVVLLAAGALVVGTQLFDDEPRTGPGTGSSPSDTEASTDLCGGPQPAPTTPPAEVSDWTQEVQRLYSLRAQAFEEGDPALLCQVHAPSNPVLAEDARLLEEYSEAGVHTDGLVFEVVNAEFIEQDSGRVTLTITQRIPDYRLVNSDGDVEQEIQGTEDETWEAELVAVANDDGTTSSWRFG